MADAVCVCYGVRCEVDSADAPRVALLEQGRHPWQLQAEQRGLTCNWGHTAAEGRLYVLLGMTLGFYGRDFEEYEQFSDEVIALGCANVAVELRGAGIEQQPAWHFQLEPDR